MISWLLALTRNAFVNVLNAYEDKELGFFLSYWKNLPAGW
jgi:hypothetical protein